MLIVGLGNPGAQYEKNRHNAGWIQLDKFAQQASLSFGNEKKHRALVARGNYLGKNIILAKPQTYMNLSGESVRSLADYYRIEPKQIAIVYDDKDFDLGSFKLKANGSAAGHNGIKSILAHLGTENFTRFRIGVGPKPKEMDMAHYVLQNFSNSEMKILLEVCERGVSALDMLIAEGLEKTMNNFNRKE